MVKQILPCDSFFSKDCRCWPGFLFDVEQNKCITKSECGCMKFDHFFRVSIL